MRRVVHFIATGFPETRLVMIKTKQQLDELQEDSLDVFELNAFISRYENRPPCLNDLCLADFAAWYERKGPYHVKNTEEIENEDDVVFMNENDKEMDETDILIIEEKVKRFASLSSYRNNKLGKRKREKIIRFVNHRHSTDSLSLEYMYENVLLFIPFKNEQIDIPFKSVPEIFFKHRLATTF